MSVRKLRKFYLLMLTTLNLHSSTEQKKAECFILWGSNDVLWGVLHSVCQPPFLMNPVLESHQFERILILIKVSKWFIWKTDIAFGPQVTQSWLSHRSRLKITREGGVQNQLTPHHKIHFQSSGHWPIGQETVWTLVPLHTTEKWDYILR